MVCSEWRIQLAARAQLPHGERQTMAGGSNVSICSGKLAILSTPLESTLESSGYAS